MMAMGRNDTPPASEIAAGILDRVCAMLLAEEARFNALDRAIGDGDHGHNLSRAARGLAEIRDEIARMPIDEMMMQAGKCVVMSVGGASGPLYGTLLLEIGKTLPLLPERADWAEAFTAGVAAVGRRGRSAEGDKTMLDVLSPAAAAFEQDQGDLASAISAMVEAAKTGLEKARPLRAARGRAAFVGERSEGHDDPGAVSSLMCITTVAEALQERIS